MIYVYSIKYMLRKKSRHSAYENVSKQRGAYRNKKYFSGHDFLHVQYVELKHFAYETRGMYQDYLPKVTIPEDFSWDGNWFVFSTCVLAQIFIPTLPPRHLIVFQAG